MKVTKSDIDQLVVGYVSEQRYFETRNKLFQESPNLPEKFPILSLFGDISSENRLHTILNQYVQLKTKQLPVCAACDEQASISDLWMIFDRIINKIRNHKEAPSPQKPMPSQELRRYSPTHFILESNKSILHSGNDASEPKSIRRKMFNPLSNQYETESIILPKRTNESVSSRGLESGRRKKTTMPRRLINSNTNVSNTSLSNIPSTLLSCNDDLSRLLNLPDNNDALALVGCEILKNMKKCAEKGSTSEQLPEIDTTIPVRSETLPTLQTPTKNQDAPTLDIDDLISDETRGGLVEMTIESLLNPEYEGLADMTSSSVNNEEEDFSELRKLLDLDDSSSSRLTLPDLIQSKQDEKYLIEIINAPTDQGLPENPIPMDFEPQKEGTPVLICEENEDEKFVVDDMTARENEDMTSKSNPINSITPAIESISTMTSHINATSHIVSTTTSANGRPIATGTLPMTTHDVAAMETEEPLPMNIPSMATHNLVATATSVSKATIAQSVANIVHDVTTVSSNPVTTPTDDVTLSHDPVNEAPISSSSVYITANCKDTQIGGAFHNEIQNDENTNSSRNGDGEMNPVSDASTNTDDIEQNTSIEILVPANKSCIAMPPKKRFLAKEGATPLKSNNHDAPIENTPYEKNLNSSALTGELMIDENSDFEMSNDAVMNDVSSESVLNETEKSIETSSPPGCAKEQEKSDSKTIEIDISPRKGRRSKKPKLSLKDIVGKRKVVSKNSRKKNAKTEKSDDEHDDIVEPSIKVMKPGHGSVVINLKDRGRMPIHVKGIVVHAEKNKSLSKKDIINQLVGQMHQPSSEAISDSQINVCDVFPNKEITPSMENITTSKIIDPEPRNVNSSLSQSINISQFQSTQSSTSHGNITNFVSLLSTPPKLSYSKHFSTISPSAGIFSVIKSNTKRTNVSSLTTSTPNQFSEARVNLLESFVQQEQNVSCVHQSMTDSNHGNMQSSDYTELATVTLSQPEAVRNQIPQTTRRSACPTTVQKPVVTKNRNLINTRKSATSQNAAKKTNRSIFLCSKMKNMVKIEPKKYGAPAIRRCLLGTAPNQLERSVESNLQGINNVEATERLQSSVPVHAPDTASQSQPIDFDQFFDFGNDTTTNTNQNTGDISKTGNKDFADPDQLHCFVSMLPSPVAQSENVNEIVPKISGKNESLSSQSTTETMSQKPQSEFGVGLKKTADKNAKKSRRKKEKSSSKDGSKKRKRSETIGSPIMKWSYEKIQARLNEIHSSQLSCTTESISQSNTDNGSATAHGKNSMNHNVQLSRKETNSASEHTTAEQETKSTLSNFETQNNLTNIFNSEKLDVPIIKKNSSVENYLLQYEAEKESAINSIIQHKEDSRFGIYMNPVLQLEPLDLSLPAWGQSPQKNTFTGLTAAESNILSMASQRTIEEELQKSPATQTTVKTLDTPTDSPLKTVKGSLCHNRENIRTSNISRENVQSSKSNKDFENDLAMIVCKSKTESASKQDIETELSSVHSQNNETEKIQTKKRSRKKKKKDRLSLLMNLSQEELQAKLDSLHNCGSETPKYSASSNYEDSSNSKHSNIENKTHGSNFHVETTSVENLTTMGNVQAPLCTISSGPQSMCSRAIEAPKQKRRKQDIKNKAKSSGKVSKHKKSKKLEKLKNLDIQKFLSTIHYDE